MLDVVADLGVTVAVAVKLLAWIVVCGCVASGWAAMGVPGPSPAPGPPTLAQWHRGARRLIDEIEHAVF